jgi:hypothetical protein
MNKITPKKRKEKFEVSASIQPMRIYTTYSIMIEDIYLLLSVNVHCISLSISRYHVQITHIDTAMYVSLTLT